MTFVFISHLLDDPYLFHKKAEAGAGQTGARSGHRQSWLFRRKGYPEVLVRAFAAQWLISKNFGIISMLKVVIFIPPFLIMGKD